MNTRVTIVPCYVKGTSKMFSVCLRSIIEHTKIPVNILVAAQEGNLDDDLFSSIECFRNETVSVQVVEVPLKYIKEGREHGSILDRSVDTEVLTEYVLTLDSDCLPIADGWLTHLIELMDNNDGLASAGILHPWGPPPDMPNNKLEWRVRSQHCWETTHVACQLMRLTDVLPSIHSGIGYADGDDTGLGMIKSLKDRGLKCGGFKPTRCPKPEIKFDAEFNRYSGVVYGDAVVHIGGFTRETVNGDDGVFGKAFGWASERILSEGSAEFLLKDEYSYQYTLDREDEVAAEKMQRLFGLVSQRMTV